MTENSGWRVCLFRNRKVLGRAGWRQEAHSWPGLGKVWGQAAASEWAPYPPLPRPFLSGSKGLTTNLRAGLCLWQGSK